MKLIDEIEADKLRGAFYTTHSLVERCYDRIGELLTAKRSLRFLEPSAGNGAFIEGMQAFTKNQCLTQSHITCVELIPAEANKCRQQLNQTKMQGDVFCQSFFEWASENKLTFDAVIGNPPFIRYQFVPEQDRLWAEWTLLSQGHKLDGVSNMWIPFVLLSLSFLREGGAFALVLPSELLTTVSGAQVRTELIRKFHSLRIDLFPRDAFPDILQDVLVVSGVRTYDVQSQRTVIFSEYENGIVREWEHLVDCSCISWTRYLLSAAEWEAYSSVKDLSGFYALGSIAAIGVAIVTGANEFFTVDTRTLTESRLEVWREPLLARTADSPGLIFTEADHANVQQSDKKSWLLNFAANKPDPLCTELAAKYLDKGVAANLPARYKCRIRAPWYRVPHIRRGSLMMAKRAHYHHRLLQNSARVYTTDTIYRGEMKTEFQGLEARLVSGFHNSATLLAAELEGRSYGGGILELVPSEISRLCVPMLETEPHLLMLDQLSRATGGQRNTDDALIAATDEILCNLLPALHDFLPNLTSARLRLRKRRFHG